MSAHQLRTSWLLALASFTGCADAPSDEAARAPETVDSDAARAGGILFQRFNEGEGPEIVIGFPGGRVVSVRKLGGGFAGDGGPGQMALTRDGKRLAFVNFDEELHEWQLITRPLRGTIADEVIIDRNAFDVVKPAWSPDGTQLAYVGDTDTGTAVLVVPATGGTPRVVTTVPFTGTPECVAPQWSPDGKEIAYATPYSLARVRVADGQVTSIDPGNDGDLFCDAQWSPDGKSIAYTRAGDIQRIARTGGNPIVLATESERARWSPDGSQLAYLKFGADGLHVVRADGRNDRALAVTNQGGGDAPQFLADGKTILFEHFENGSRLTTISARGGDPVDLGLEGAGPDITYPIVLPVVHGQNDE